jgi:hypothetical protein
MNDLLDFLSVSPPIALAAALNGLGLALKKSPVPNWLIPLLLPIIGAAVYPFLAEPGKVNFECNNPAMLHGIYGFIIGSASVGLNQMFRQFNGRRNRNGDTEILRARQER